MTTCSLRLSRCIGKAARGGSIRLLRHSTSSRDNPPRTQRAAAQETAKPNNPFILLLNGIYRPVANGPDLGLSSVNLLSSR